MSGYTSGKATHDPRPWLHDHHVECSENGGRMATNNGVGNVYDPRPEYDNHNPILVAFRGDVTEPGADPDHIWDSTMEWLAHAHESDPYCVRTGIGAEHMAHARRVLGKLQALMAVSS